MLRTKLQFLGMDDTGKRDILVGRLNDYYAKLCLQPKDNVWL